MGTADLGVTADGLQYFQLSQCPIHLGRRDMFGPQLSSPPSRSLCSSKVKHLFVADLEACHTDAGRGWPTEQDANTSLSSLQA